MKTYKINFKVGGKTKMRTVTKPGWLEVIDWVLAKFPKAHSLRCIDGPFVGGKPEAPDWGITPEFLRKAHLMTFYDDKRKKPGPSREDAQECGERESVQDAGEPSGEGEQSAEVYQTLTPK